MSIKRESQIPADKVTQAPLARAPRTDVVDAVTAPTPKQSAVAVVPTPKKRTVTFTNRLDPDLLDWLDANKQRTKVTIAAALDEAVRDYIKKVSGESI